MKKLSKKERNEYVTKGYLEDVLDDRFNKFEIRFEAKLDQKLDQKFDEKFDQKFDEKFALWSAEMTRHVAALIENSDSKFEIFYEGFEGHDVRIRRLERQVKYTNL